LDKTVVEADYGKLHEHDENSNAGEFEVASNLIPDRELHGLPDQVTGVKSVLDMIFQHLDPVNVRRGWRANRSRHGAGEAARK
jgi:hypothetical protein